MTTDQDLPMDGPAATAMFAAKGIDVTPNKDQGVIKVLTVTVSAFKMLSSASLWMLPLM